jgi:methionyl aminopeptidase
MIELRTDAEIDQMKAAGAFVSQTLSALMERVDAGVNLLELDAFAHDLIRERGAESCYLDYAPSFGKGPFGYVLCTSVNDAALHGKPFDYALRDGDLLSLDFAAIVDGWAADSARSIAVGGGRKKDRELIALTERALNAGIDAAVVGGRIGDISAAIGRTARSAGIKVNRDFGGHGVGRTMHGDPHIANEGVKGSGELLRHGLVVAIEPWFMLGTDKLRVDADGWTLRSADGSKAAHSEHTVAITNDGPIVLTAY